VLSSVTSKVQLSDEESLHRDGRERERGEKGGIRPLYGVPAVNPEIPEGGVQEEAKDRRERGRKEKGTARLGFGCGGREQFASETPGGCTETDCEQRRTSRHKKIKKKDAEKGGGF